MNTNPKRRRRTIFAVLFLFNVLCNAIIAMAAFGFVPGTRDWKFARGWETFWSLFGSVGSVIAAIVAIGIIGVVLLGVVASTTTMWKVLSAAGVIVLLVLSALFGRYVFDGSALFFVLFVAVFVAEVAVEHWLSKKIQASASA